MSETEASCCGRLQQQYQQQQVKPHIWAGGGFIAWLLSIDILPWLGFAVALGGFIVNLIFKFLENKRAAELHRINMRKMMCRNGEYNEVDR